jgi:hypothetical protein
MATAKRPNVKTRKAWRCDRMVRRAEREIEIIEDTLIMKLVDTVDGVVRSNSKPPDGAVYVKLELPDFIMMGRLRAYRDMRWT